MKTKSSALVRSTFALPAVIFGVSLAGLVAGLVGDGWLDWLSWLGLAAPLAAVVWAMTRKG
jgi:hypothetical protein